MEEKFSVQLENLIKFAPFLTVKPTHFRDLMGLLKVEAQRREDWEERVEHMLYERFGESV